jgi:hypothetical protein
MPRLAGEDTGILELVAMFQIDAVLHHSLLVRIKICMLMVRVSIVESPVCQMYTCQPSQEKFLYFRYLQS